MVLGCSNLTEGAGGVVELQIGTPAATEVEVGEALQLTARALDRDGNPLDIPVTWISSDPALTVDNTGLVTAVAPGTAQIQASVGSLTSQQIPLTAIPRADTLALVGDSVVIVPAGVNASAPLVVQLLNFAQGTPLPTRPVIYTVSFPAHVTGAQATLPGGILVDTISTGTTGLDQSMILSRGFAYADTAFVTVRSYRASNADVPGSGQRFIVLFQ
jgi:hypothetical protein